MIQHTIGQQIVLGQHFCDWPETKTYDEIMLIIKEGNDEDNEENDIGIWEPFDEWDKGFLINHLYDLSQAIDAAIKEITTP